MDEENGPAAFRDAAAFVRAHTAVRAVPLVPEVRLHTGGEVVDLWESTERNAGGAGEELPPPFWAFPWAGGQALARHVLDHPGLVAGRRVFDLASGSGLVAVAAALAGAAEVVANDVDPLAVVAVALNAEVNGVSIVVEPGDVLDTDPEADVVLAGDVFYDRWMAARVLPFLRRAAVRGALVLVGDPQRAHLPREGLRRVAEHVVPVPATLESAETRTTTVWSLAR
ncbi:class I SAM-dependent methyltransferase [Umezawaea beigongshangensis]|uniref:class I SAM-dependent methyltransferase n=1 Tax=Umezawaea beigongshangensis TaxID=2780383 RepID=UPI0018F16113|nr:50S ribosomal protein L11 methyltransferase [Umezawaea beigongshangensis]